MYMHLSFNKIEDPNNISIMDKIKKNEYDGTVCLVASKKNK